MQRTADKAGFKLNGFAMLGVTVLVLLGMIASVAIKMIVLFFVLVVSFVLLVMGFYTVQPNESRVLIFLGSYTGTIRDAGFWWSNPIALKKNVSLRVRNFNSERLKVNDADGNPIEIAAVVVWKVKASASALFDVDSYADFVELQSETAIRSLSSLYPYDKRDSDQISLRGNPEEVSLAMQKELEARLMDAGVEVIEARISHLAYAQEIAQAMLRRQQAQAIIDARTQIVEGAVGMVQMALTQLSEQNIVELDSERKAQMVNNLMVALVSEQESQPIINTGTLY